LCYSEHYLEDTSQQVDSGIAAWMWCVAVNIIWKILHSMWTVVLQVEWSVLQWTLYGRYFTAGGQLYYRLNGVCFGRYFTAGGKWYCSLNEVCYSEYYLEDSSQQVDSGITGWMECVTVNIIWKIFHSKWKVVLQVERIVLQWTLSGRYFTAGGQWYCSLNVVCCCEHYMEDISQQEDSVITGWMECVTVDNIWKILHSSLTVVLQLEWSVFLWTLSGWYFTAGGEWYCSLNEVCYSEHYMEDTAQQVDSGIAAWMNCVTVNIIWKIFHSMWTVVLELEWGGLQWTLFWRFGPWRLDK